MSPFPTMAMHPTLDYYRGTRHVPRNVIGKLLFAPALMWGIVLLGYASFYLDMSLEVSSFYRFVIWPYICVFGSTLAVLLSLIIAVMLSGTVARLHGVTQRARWVTTHPRWGRLACITILLGTQLLLVLPGIQVSARILNRILSTGP
jgi:hypothetical protein